MPLAHRKTHFTIYVGYILALLAFPGCESTKPTLDETINTWSMQAADYARQVTDRNEMGSRVFLELAEMYARLGHQQQSLVAARKVTAAAQQQRLATALAPFVTEQTAIEIVQELPDLAARDEALSDFAFAHAREGRYDIAKRFVHRMSNETQMKGWLRVAGAQEFRNEYQTALETLGQIESSSQAQRQYIDQARNRLSQRLKDPNAADHVGARAQRDLPTELAVAKLSARQASTPDAEAVAWQKVAAIQRDLNCTVDSRASLVRAESASDRTSDASLRASALAQIVDEYRRLGDRENVIRVALKGVAALGTLPMMDHSTTENEHPYAFLRRISDEQNQLTQIELLVASRQIDKALELAARTDYWKTLGSQAAKDEDTLRALEESLKSVQSNSAKALICTGVVERLQARRSGN